MKWLQEIIWLNRVNEWLNRNHQFGIFLALHLWTSQGGDQGFPPCFKSIIKLSKTVEAYRGETIEKMMGFEGRKRKPAH